MLTLDKDDLREVKAVFNALSNGTRIKILLSLKQGEKCVHEIADLIDHEISNVSHHLRRLRENKLVDYRKEGRHKYYHITDEHILNMLEEGINYAQS